ncbi:MAG: hypothetical protein KDA86_25895 [Planctomycetaceae bacterium]|nr:hypothetical protein [Planctomycetaceae bacterium]
MTKVVTLADRSEVHRAAVNRWLRRQYAKLDERQKLLDTINRNVNGERCQSFADSGEPQT